MAGRPANQLETMTVTLSTTPVVMQYLQDLVSSGLYGKNPAEAAERVLAAAIEAMVQQGRLQSRIAR